METANQIANWISLIAIIIAFIISIIQPGRKNLFPIQLYIIVSIVANLIINIFDGLPSNSSYKKIAQATFNIYSILEISLIYYFLFFRIRGKGFRITMLISFLIYILACFVIWIFNTNLFFSFGPDLSGVEGLFITVTCFFYIYEILKSDLNMDLRSNANFIVTCGILFYFSVSIPTYFSWYNLHYMSPGFEKIVILINSVFYTILFISFTKAYICPLPQK